MLVVAMINKTAKSSSKQAVMQLNFLRTKVDVCNWCTTTLSEKILEWISSALISMQLFAAKNLKDDENYKIKNNHRRKRTISEN